MRRTLIRWLLRAIAVFVLLIAFAFWLAFFSSRPPLTIEPATLAGSGANLDYCRLPTLDGRGKIAADIPKGNTPGCGYDHFPLPILGDCTEPLPDEAADIRGLWQATTGKIGHVERIEQCGSRVVVTAAGIIHDYGPNSSAGLNTNDTEGSVLFTIGDREFCARTSASMIWNEGQLDFFVFGWGPRVVRRYPDGDDLIWEYVDGSVTQMRRICQLPDEHRAPTPRGRRFRLWG